MGMSSTNQGKIKWIWRKDKESIISVVSHNKGVKTIDEIIAVNISNWWKTLIYRS